MPPSHLEITKMNVDNLSENVVPQSAEACFNVRFNSKYKSSSLKKKINRIISMLLLKKINVNIKLIIKFLGKLFILNQIKKFIWLKK